LGIGDPRSGLETLWRPLAGSEPRRRPPRAEPVKRFAIVPFANERVPARGGVTGGAVLTLATCSRRAGRSIVGPCFQGRSV
jgi:hypothetical protein